MAALAMQGGTAATATTVPLTITPRRSFDPWLGLRSSYGGGFGGVPRYNQRKSRKLASRCGIHPANSKRR